MKGFILTLVGDILLINVGIIITVGSKLVGTPDSTNIPLQTVLSGSFGSTALTFLILACEVILTGLVVSIIGLIGNIKSNDFSVTFFYLIHPYLPFFVISLLTEYWE